MPEKNEAYSMTRRLYILYLIIFLEGYVVLSTELLAIRLTIPFVGSGADTISIIIAGVLLPLAFGYYRGGQFKFSAPKDIDKKLQKNVLLSFLILAFGLSYIAIAPIFEYFIKHLEFTNRIGLATIYTFAMIIMPVYWLAQTIPIISNHLGNTKLPEAAGKILFFSTLGSFAGAVISTIFLMNIIGVPYTACITFFCLLALVYMLNQKQVWPPTLATLLFIVTLALNSPYALSKYNLVNSNAYNFVQVYEHQGKTPIRLLKLNGAFSSSIDASDKNKELPMAYANYIEKHFIRPAENLGPDAKILILGAGGFTIGRNNNISQITYVDIDPDLEAVVEQDFLKENLDKNKTFVAQPARSFLMSTQNDFDLIVLDIGKGLTGSPEHLITREFFQQVKKRLKINGVLVAHYYISAMMEGRYALNLDTTLKSVFPNMSRVITDGYNPWPSQSYKSSIVYIYKNFEDQKQIIYTDTLNRATMDKSKELY